MSQIRAFARSFDRLRLGLALSLTVAACGPLPEGAEAPAEAAPDVAQQQQPLLSGDCLQILNQCNARCARLEQSGEDATICYSDCSAQFYNCQCRKNPRFCFQG